MVLETGFRCFLGGVGGECRCISLDCFIVTVGSYGGRHAFHNGRCETPSSEKRLHLVYLSLAVCRGRDRPLRDETSAV